MKFSNEARHGLPVVIILEGARGVGKTTIAKALAEKISEKYGLQVNILKMERGKNPVTDMQQTLREMEDLLDEPVVTIIDRFHITEYVLRISEKGLLVKQTKTRERNTIQAQLNMIGGITCLLWTSTKRRLFQVIRRGDGRPDIGKNARRNWQLVAETAPARNWVIHKTGADMRIDTLLAKIEAESKLWQKQSEMLSARLESED